MRTLDLEQGTLVFTYCQIPIVYRLTGREAITLHSSDGSIREVDGTALDRETSSEIFRRSGRIVRIDVHLRRAPNR